jgi:hypothetical protein
MSEKEKIVLKDRTEYEIENGAVENCVQIVISDLDELKVIHDKFTEENLEEYQIKNAEGLVCTTRKNKFLRSALVEAAPEGFLISFPISDVDMTEKRLKAVEAGISKIKTGQDLQDGAISDLGDVISGIVEGGEK